jgi:ABC-type polysaccharide/polyol phosphate transport system ATPase subunit
MAVNTGIPGDNIAIKVDDLWKKFFIYHERHQTLKETVLSMRRARYEEIWGLHGIDLEVGKGQTFGIIGENGSGKSTLLKVIARILQPDRGDVSTNGRISALLELGAGFHPDLTGRENIYLNGAILRLSKKEISERFDRIVDFAELERFIDTPVKNYSSGMYMRLGFAIAINVDPDILLVDEVLAVGDEAFQRKCLDKIKHFKQAGGTILFVTHEVDVVKQICDRAVMLDSGKIVSQGDPKQVVRDYHDAVLTTEKGEEGGTKEIEIKRVELLNDEGTRTTRYAAGDRMIIRIHYEAKKPIEDPVFGLGVFDQRDAKCFGTNTELRQYETGRVTGKGVAEFDLKSLSMLDGKYTLTLAIHSSLSASIYHWQERYYSFEVYNDYRDEGNLFIPLDFKLKPDK